MKKHLIKAVENDSIAESIGISAGDYLLSVNGREVIDVLDYRMETYSSSLCMKIEKDSGISTYDISKDENEDIGLVFENGLMDKPRKCANNCIFCFVDQLPDNLRDTLYFKDDDIRLSFLTGNYITLTNTTDRELHRIISHRLSPINISVHATNPELRILMTGNKKAGRILDQISRLNANGIEVNAQIVVVPGVNDGSELERSLRELSAFDKIRSVAVVPVGLTKFRKPVDAVRGITSAEAADIINITDEARSNDINPFEEPRIFAADELYIRSGIEIPSTGYYGDYPQYENGVGLVRCFIDEFTAAFEQGALNDYSSEETYTLVTGESFYDYLVKLVNMLDNTGEKINVLRIENQFFGNSVTVAGLLSFSDIAMQMKSTSLKNTVILPENMFRKSGDLTLDGYQISDFEKVSGRKVMVVPCDGETLYNVLTHADDRRMF